VAQCDAWGRAAKGQKETHTHECECAFICGDSPLAEMKGFEPLHRQNRPTGFRIITPTWMMTVNQGR
ncbi:MAG TPA: hypothetical protein H9712_07590, partial [Candidatus Flavonifractor intestinigallinarum]|nr:hypothetical protein [Candidatus Flavonifractor intestinigallinarum]